MRISWQELPRQLRARDLEQFETNSSPGGVRRDDPSNGVTMGSQSNITKKLNLTEGLLHARYGLTHLSVRQPCQRS